MNFSDLDLHPSLLRGISDLGWTEPTPVQRKAVPAGLEGRDLLAAAMTGSGKTAAFLLPMLQRFVEQSRGHKGQRGGQQPNRQPNRQQGHVRALVLTPTRELAAQVESDLKAIARHTRITSVTVFGGVNPRPQERALRRGVDVVVATPGRLLDHLSQPWCNLDQIEVLVLDEADRMLDMGFLPDVKRILRQLPKQKQTFFFSATLPKPIVQLSRELLHDPARVDVERKAAPAKGIDQAILPVPEKLKPALLLEMLRRDHVDTALVFTRTKHRANRLAEFLDKAGIACDRIHGNRSQNQRQKALSAFKHGRLQVLVATDIAARGIDVEALPHVINFDVPGQAEDYIHRVGRTARARSTGTALTFASPKEERELRAIERAVGERLERKQIEGFDYNAQPNGRFEIPIGERIAEIRARKSQDRERSRAKAEKRGGGRGGSRPNSNRSDSGRSDSGRSDSDRSGSGRPRRRRSRRRANSPR
ncbi:MAG: DEAD/DEAH box helicase [Acidobacteriota bacterium]|nr:DEAD/DEAH box helicase [Acidobacteriota bacterium]